MEAVFDQCRQPSLSTSVLKAAGIRGGSPSAGTLRRGQGAPAAPQGQTHGPSHGRSGWVSQTQPVSSQISHFIVDPSAERDGLGRGRGAIDRGRSAQLGRRYRAPDQAACFDAGSRNRRFVDFRRQGFRLTPYFRVSEGKADAPCIAISGNWSVCIAGGMDVSVATLLKPDQRLAAAAAQTCRSSHPRAISYSGTLRSCVCAIICDRSRRWACF